jgi:long-chain acyl-CoA synthetase
LGEVPAALVQLRPGATVDEKVLQDFTAGRLAAFKVPVKVHVSYQALKRNEGGKLMKSELRKVFGA